MADKANFTPAQQAGHDTRQADVDRTLAAMHRLEAARGWILTALRHQQAHESDLIYGAYYDAFERELPSEKP